MMTNKMLDELGLTSDEKRAYWEDEQRIKAKKKIDKNYKSEDELRIVSGLI